MPAPYTPSQTVGPFFSFGLCVRRANLVVPAETEGAVRVMGRVLDGAGDGVPDAMVEIWQANTAGEYREDFGWGRSGTDAEGRFDFVIVKPGSTGHGAARQAPHLTVLVFARGLLKPLLTRMYFPDEVAANAADPVLGGIADPAERATLLAKTDGEVLRFDIHLQGAEQTTFFAL
jgi:protocatechuate 3,4-dioxygenase, alpha subunit